MANVKAYFSCIKPTANKWDRMTERFAERQIDFFLASEQVVGQETRILLDLLCGRNDLAWMVERFTELQLDPKVIAAFRCDNGRKIRDYQIDRVEWRKVAPDVQTGTNEQGEPVYGRPPIGDFRQVHGWLGQPMDDEQDED